MRVRFLAAKRHTLVRACFRPIPSARPRARSARTSTVIWPVQVDCQHRERSDITSPPLEPLDRAPFKCEFGKYTKLLNLNTVRLHIFIGALNNNIEANKIAKASKMMPIAGQISIIRLSGHYCAITGHFVARLARVGSNKADEGSSSLRPDEQTKCLLQLFNGAAAALEKVGAKQK